MFNYTNKKVLYLDSFKIKGNPTNSERNLEILYWILDIIFTYRPYMAIIESPFISQFTINSAGPLLKLHGIIDHFLLENGLKIYEITPPSSRAFLGIKPNTKEEAFKFIKKEFEDLQLGTFKKDNDKSDALILALNYNNEKLKKVE